MPNWYKKQVEKGLPEKAKRRKDVGNWNVLDTQLLCCGYPENRRQQGNEYEKKNNGDLENPKVT